MFKKWIRNWLGVETTIDEEKIDKQIRKLIKISFIEAFEEELYSYFWDKHEWRDLRNTLSCTIAKKAKYHLKEEFEKLNTAEKFIDDVVHRIKIKQL